jgi:hypothetical protein
MTADDNYCSGDGALGDSTRLQQSGNGRHLAGVYDGSAPLVEESPDDRKTGRRVKLTPASSIPPRPVRWTWEDADGGRIPAGEITLTPGAGGIGKSTFHAHLVSRVTRGQLPGIHRGTPRGCIICASEDSWARTIVPRLMGAGADLDRVYRAEVEDAEEAGDSLRLSLPTDVDALADAIGQNDVALVSLDPLMTLIGADLDTHKDAEVRRAIEPLARLADDTGVAILGNAHFNKSMGGDPMSRITGSAAFGQVVRAVLAFARDDEAGQCVISQVKSNLGRLDLPSLAYRIEPVEIPTTEGPASVGQLVWCGQSDRSVADLLRPERKDASSEQDEAAAWLQEPDVLGGGQERRATELHEAAEVEGITSRTLQRGSAKVCERRRDGFGGQVWWKLKAAILANVAHTRQSIEVGEYDENVASMAEVAMVEGEL